MAAPGERYGETPTKRQNMKWDDASQRFEPEPGRQSQSQGQGPALYTGQTAAGAGSDPFQVKKPYLLQSAEAFKQDDPITKKYLDLYGKMLNQSGGGGGGGGGAQFGVPEINKEGIGMSDLYGQQVKSMIAFEEKLAKENPWGQGAANIQYNEIAKRTANEIEKVVQKYGSANTPAAQQEIKQINLQGKGERAAAFQAMKQNSATYNLAVAEVKQQTLQTIQATDIAMSQINAQLEAQRLQLSVDLQKQRMAIGAANARAKVAAQFEALDRMSALEQRRDEEMFKRFAAAWGQESSDYFRGQEGARSAYEWQQGFDYTKSFNEKQLQIQKDANKPGVLDFLGTLVKGVGLFTMGGG
jgi:hypothetical protein